MGYIILAIKTDWNRILANPEFYEDILERARRMDPNALGEIHDQYYPEVYRYVCYRLSDEQTCEDIASEVFLRFLVALHRRRGPYRNLRGWLIGTASNLVNEHLRHRYKRQVESIDEQAEESLGADGSPESSWDADWVRKEVQRALSELTHEQQHVLALRFSEERSLDETAKIIGKTLTAVKALQFRALASLRRSLEEGSNKR